LKSNIIGSGLRSPSARLAYWFFAGDARIQEWAHAGSLGGDARSCFWLHRKIAKYMFGA